MTVRRFWNSLKFGWRVAILWLLSGVINFVLQNFLEWGWLKTWLGNQFPGFAPGEVTYLAFVFGNLLVGVFLILLVLLVIWLENPGNIRQFFRLGPIDWRGIGLIALLTVILNVLEQAFLRLLVYDPIRLFLMSLGLRGQPALEAGFTPDARLIGLNSLLLLLIFWIEAPEEIFFRGYIQNQLQDRIGPNAALVAGAIIWSAWHLFDVADIARIFVYGLALSLVFRLRQNTTPLAIWHPLGNRLLLLINMVSAFFGSR